MADVSVYLDHQFFGDGRFGLAALILGEPPFTTEMRVIRCWRHCFNNLTPSLSKRDIRAQSQWPGDVELLLKAFVEAAIVDAKDDGTFEFHGAAARIEMIVKSVEDGRTGGLKSGIVRRARALERQLLLQGTPLEPPLNPPSRPVRGKRSLPEPRNETKRNETVTPFNPPAGGTKNRKRKIPLADEATQITDAVLSIVLDPPRAETRNEADLAICFRVPDVGRRVVERMVGADGWPMFVASSQLEIRNGFMPALHKRLTKAISAELRARAGPTAASEPPDPHDAGAPNPDET